MYYLFNMVADKFTFTEIYKSLNKSGVKMSDVKYEVIEENLKTEGLNYTSYGIIIYEGTKVIRHISDVFLNKNEAVRYVKLFNDENLSPIHIDYVIEDIISN